MEKYTKIKGYEGLYEISNLSNIKSLTRKGSDGRIIKGRVLKQNTKDIYGYIHVNLFKNGKSKNYTVHYLMATTFLNHKANGHKIVIDHIDNNPSNNSLENLQLISNRQNTSKDKKGFSSKYIGVCWHKRREKWMSSIRINGIVKYLGYFNSETEASDAYKKELRHLLA